MNGWTNGTNECLGGAVLEAVDYIKTEQLGKNAINCGVCPQLLEERHYVEISPSTANWHQPTGRHKTHKQSHTHSSQLPQCLRRSKTRGPESPGTVATTERHMKGNGNEGERSGMA
jgi:hypothetical protein